MRLPTLLVALALSSAVVLADDHIVDADRLVDFATLKSFSFRDQTIASDHPALKNSIVSTKVADTIRAALTSKGLKELPDQTDVLIDFTVTGQDYTIGPFGRAQRIDNTRGRGRRGASARGADEVDFVEGLLVIDLVARQPGHLIWRGVYRDTERDSTKFADKLPNDAKTLLASFPPKKR